MFRSNKRYQQPALISSVNDLPEKQRRRLEASWAGTFHVQFFSRLEEEAFGVLYSDAPSRPNVPVNVLVSLDTLKAGYGWSDEELYDHFLYDLQVRYAVGYENLAEGDFELRTLYSFPSSSQPVQCGTWDELARDSLCGHHRSADHGFGRADRTAADGLDANRLEHRDHEPPATDGRGHPASEPLA